MCLYVDHNITKYLKQAPSDGWIFWKIVSKSRAPAIVRSKIKYTKGKTIFISRFDYNDTFEEIKHRINNGVSTIVEKGIHVFTKKPSPDILADYNNPVLIRVLCYKDDLIAGGSNDQAVFRRITVLD